MSVHIEIHDGPLPPDAPDWDHAGAGSVIEFRGIIRPLEEDRLIDAIAYDAYRPMADQQLELIATRLAEEDELIGIFVEHSVGRVAVGKCGFRLRVASAHRAEGLEATRRFIDRLKEDVPIFKIPEWSEASHRAAT